MSSSQGGFPDRRQLTEGHLEQALAEDDPSEKNYHIRMALRTLETGDGEDRRREDG